MKAEKRVILAALCGYVIVIVARGCMRIEKLFVVRGLDDAIEAVSRSGVLGEKPLIDAEGCGPAARDLSLEIARRLGLPAHRIEGGCRAALCGFLRGLCNAVNALSVQPI